jgi:hypothetical protein
MRRSAALMPLLAVILALGLGHAQARPVDLELVLAVDVSRSVDDDEARLQREGYIAALTSPQVIRAIRSGPMGAIAVTYVEWASRDYQRTVIGWMPIDGEASAKAFAAQLAEAPRVSMNWTSISGAIDYAAGLFDGNGFEGNRRTIDVSGDGANNNGRPAEQARDEAVARGIVINGLPIINDRPNFGRPPEKDLDLYYESSVIGGPGSFMIVAEDFQAFAKAILTKLVREIAGDPSLPNRASNQAALPALP